MEKIGTVAESYKSRRIGGSLGHVIDLKAFTFIGRRLNFCGCISEHIVEHTGGNSSAVLLVSGNDKLKKFVKTLAGFCGNEHERSI